MESEIKEEVKNISINEMIQILKSTNKDFNAGNISDGHHSFDELYEHRNVLYITVCKLLAKHTDITVWKTIPKDGWFLLILRPYGTQISYHLPESKYEECPFPKIGEGTNYKYTWDSHTHKDALERLKTIA